MKVANIPFTDAFHSAQKSISKVRPQNVETLGINNATVLVPVLLIYDFEGGY
jgi:hypothetical protein